MFVDVESMKENVIPRNGNEENHPIHVYGKTKSGRNKDVHGKMLCTVKKKMSTALVEAVQAIPHQNFGHDKSEVEVRHL